MWLKKNVYQYGNVLNRNIVGYINLIALLEARRRPMCNKTMCHCPHHKIPTFGDIVTVVTRDIEEGGELFMYYSINWRIVVASIMAQFNCFISYSLVEFSTWNLVLWAKSGERRVENLNYDGRFWKRSIYDHGILEQNLAQFVERYPNSIEMITLFKPSSK